MNVTYKKPNFTIETDNGKINLYATDALKLAREIYKTKDVAGGRDQIQMLMIILKCDETYARRVLAGN